MAVIGLESYKFGTKNNWRRWQWNEISRRIKEQGRPVKEAFGLYLCGPDDEDRKVAISKWFSPHNLIAVDINEENIKKIRAKRNIGICDDLNKILKVWPETLKIDFIVADFCCGITKTTIEFIYSVLCCKGISTDTVISVNLMRGRDMGKSFSDLNKNKNRGNHFLTSYILCYMNNPSVNFVPYGYVKSLEPTFKTYKSSCGIYFDSAVFMTKYTFGLGIGNENKYRSVMNKVNALRAIRTQRLNGSI